MLGDLDTLITHGLRSLRDSIQSDKQDKGLTLQNCSIAFVGKDPLTGKFQKFVTIDGDGIQRYLDLLGDDAIVTSGSGGGGGGGGSGGESGSDASAPTPSTTDSIVSTSAAAKTTTTTPTTTAGTSKFGKI